MSLTGRFLTKKRENIETEAADLHPFSRVKPKKKSKVWLFMLILLTVIVYSFIFLLELYEDIKDNHKNEVAQISQQSVKPVQQEKKIKRTVIPSFDEKTETVSKAITEKINSSGILSLVPEKPVFKKEKKEKKPVKKEKKSKREIILSYIKKGKAAEKRKDIKSAIYYYKKAWRLNKGNSDLIYKIADLHYKGGYYKASIKYANQVLKLKNDYIPAIVLKAKSYGKLGMREKEKAILEEAYFSYPENKAIILNLAKTYEKEKALFVAKDLYKILDDMGYLEGTLGLARINEKLGNRKEAYRIYSKVLKNPDLPDDIKYKVEEKLLILGD
ncbi:tetratricopeptide repeat protein [Persephonella sp.]